jgi:peroxiredoxin
MSLQDKLDAFRANFEAGGPPYNAPAWIHEPMHRATAELIASGAAQRALKVGDQAPDFIPKDLDDNTVSSAELLKQNKLSFPILSDPHSDIAASFGIRFGLPDYLSDLYKNVFTNDLEVVNGDDSWTLPMPAHFVIGRDGIIRYAEVNPDYTRRPDPDELLPVLDRIPAAV